VYVVGPLIRPELLIAMANVGLSPWPHSLKSLYGIAVQASLERTGKGHVDEELSTASQKDEINLTRGSNYLLTNISTTMSAISSISTKKGNNFTVGQSWGALRKAWKGYRIAKVQGDNGKMREYATKIRKIQGELGVSVASFPQLGIN